jgi:hypothetical protein
MSTLSTLFRATADLLTGTLPDAASRGPFSFYGPDPVVSYDKLPGFNNTIGEPSMRRCCAIGWKSATGAPISLFDTRPLDQQTLYHHAHIYGGPGFTAAVSKDPVGHIYSARGGILDIGHIRDHADLARYIAVRARLAMPDGLTLTLSPEAGARRVRFQRTITPPSPWVAAVLGARISYELSIWHEIVTWAAQNTGFPTLQPYSAFSPEDNYSNLLGAFLGYQAVLKSETEFDDAMTTGLAGAAFRLRPLDLEGTRQAVDYVEGQWFRYVGGKLELLRRHFNALGTVEPWLIQTVSIPGRQQQLANLQERTNGETRTEPVTVPELGRTGAPLSSLYTLEFEVNRSLFPAVFFDALPDLITPAHFPTVIERVKNDVLATLPGSDTPD